jgi:hypothetical protein
VPVARGNGKRNGKYTFGNRRKTEGYSEGFARTKTELAAVGGAGDGQRDGKRLASVEGALAELELCQRFMERKVRARAQVEGQRGGTSARRFVFGSGFEEPIENVSPGWGPDSGERLTGIEGQCDGRRDLGFASARLAF